MAWEPVVSPADFAQQVHDAVAHLHDPVYLQAHPLAQQLSRQDKGVLSARAGVALQRRLLDAIAALRPLTKVSEASPAWRGHRLLNLRYAESLDPSTVQRQLGTSKSQYYREQTRALNALAAVLADRWPSLPHAQSGSLATEDAPQSAPIRPSAAAGHLPRQLTSFVGRERELSEVVALLSQVRLLTLTGPGGSGKTRLALEVAATVAGTYPDGVWFVDLAPLRDPALVLSAVAQALSVREQVDRPLADSLSDFLRDRHLLLVLDNFEHVLSAGPAIASLLGACANVQALVTSREVLRVSGEQNYPTPPLALPDRVQDADPARLVQSEAVALFLQRAQAARPAFRLTGEQAPVVAKICRRLDGLPLAIELAAAHLRAFTLGDILERLDSRSRLLASVSRTAPARHQSLQATLDWSYRLLAKPEQALLTRLAVFAGGWTLDAAEAVCAGNGLDPQDVAGLLASLVDKSLVVAEEDADGRTRFRLLETLRQYAAERLAELGDEIPAQRDHLLYFTNLVEQTEAAMIGPEQGRWFDRLDRELDNIRTAVRVAIDHPTIDHPTLGLRLAGALFYFWIFRGHAREAAAWLDALLSRSSGATEGSEPEVALKARSRALLQAGFLARFLGDQVRSRALQEEGLALAQEVGDFGRVADALFHLGWGASARGDVVAAQQFHENAVALYQHAGNLDGAALATHMLGGIARQQGDYETAGRHFETALALFRRTGNRNREAGVLNAMGYLHRSLEDAATAYRLHEEALEIWREQGYLGGVAGALNGMGEAAAELGDVATARNLYEQSIAHWRDLYQESIVHRPFLPKTLSNLALLDCATGDALEAYHALREACDVWEQLDRSHQIADALVEFALLLVRQRHPRRALRLLGAAAALREAAQRPLSAALRERLERDAAPARQALGGEADAAEDEGRAMTLDQIIEEAVGCSFAGPAGERMPRATSHPDTDTRPSASERPSLATLEDTSPNLPLRVDTDLYQIWQGDRLLTRRLSAQEFALVSYLYARRERVCTRQEVGDAIWGAHQWDPTMLRRLVRRTREKLEPHPSEPRYILSVPGIGYRLITTP
jgi:predicted ATPase